MEEKGSFHFQVGGSGGGDLGHGQWSIIGIDWLNDILPTSIYTTTATTATVSFLGNGNSRKLFWWLVWPSSSSEEVKFTFWFLAHQSNPVLNQTFLDKKNITKIVGSHRGLIFSTDINQYQFSVKEPSSSLIDKVSYGSAKETEQIGLKNDICKGDILIIYQLNWRQWKFVKITLFAAVSKHPLLWRPTLQN